MKRSDKFEAVRRLIDLAIDHQASDEEISTLKEWLQSDPEAQAFYFEYIELHTRLSAAADSTVEFVYRTMTEEELIMRPMHRSSAPNITEPEVEALSGTLLEQSAQDSHDRPRLFTITTVFAIAAALLITGFALYYWLTDRAQTRPAGAIVFSGVLAPGKFGLIEDNTLALGEYRVKTQASIGLRSGETLNFAEGSLFILQGRNRLSLAEGELTIIPVPNNSIEVSTQNFTAYSNGGELAIDLRYPHPRIDTGENTLFTPKRWRPSHYWSFEGDSDRAVDSAGNADGVVYPGAVRSAGLVGTGAFSFDNSMNTRLNLGSGGGSALGTGSFAATEGITIEALIQPSYTGKLGESDHIFRKGQSDGQLRILLSLQNDRGKNYLRPEGRFAESISFGLFLLGQGYHELKLPLDGLEGRPTLAELNRGEPTHIVATYRAKTGLKAIYLNGERMASYQYPAGSKMLSGGAGQANIGNSPTFPRQHRDRHGFDVEHSGQIIAPKLSRGVIDIYSAAFNGVIDEVAFYNFSLTDMVIQQHFNFIQQGQNYFGLMPSQTDLPDTIKMPLPAKTSLQIEPITGQPQVFTE